MSELKVLAIETADRWGSVAAAAVSATAAAPTASVVDAEPLPRDRRSAQTLAPTIDGLLRRVGWKPGELDAVAVAVGPGSFTGLRVGVTTAKTLAYANDARLVAVGTLDALVEPHRGERRVWGVLEAQRGEAFAASCAAGAETASVLRVAKADLVQRVSAGDLVVGPIAAALSGLDEAQGGVEWRVEDPTAAAVARLGAAKLSAGDTVDPFQLVPAYHRASAAEEKADAATT